MSRRKRRPTGGAGTGVGEPASGAAGVPAAPGAGAGEGGSARGAAPPPGRRIARDIAVLIAVFAVTAGIAELAGATSLGIALGVGQVAFALAVMVLLLRG